MTRGLALWEEAGRGITLWQAIPGPLWVGSYCLKVWQYFGEGGGGCTPENTYHAGSMSPRSSFLLCISGGHCCTLTLRHLGPVYHKTITFVLVDATVTPTLAWWSLKVTDSYPIQGLWKAGWPIPMSMVVPILHIVTHTFPRHNLHWMK